MRDFIEIRWNLWYIVFKEVITVAENKLADMSTEFSIQILKLTENIKGHYSLSNQLERSGTSIGANISEAVYGNSKADFISKLHISLKETGESIYWITLLKRTNLIEYNFDGLLSIAEEIKRMLIASLNTAKENNK